MESKNSNDPKLTETLDNALAYMDVNRAYAMGLICIFVVTFSHRYLFFIIELIKLSVILHPDIA